MDPGPAPGPVSRAPDPPNNFCLPFLMWTWVHYLHPEKQIQKQNNRNPKRGPRSGPRSGPSQVRPQVQTRPQVHIIIMDPRPHKKGKKNYLLGLELWTWGRTWVHSHSQLHICPLIWVECGNRRKQIWVALIWIGPVSIHVYAVMSIHIHTCFTALQYGITHSERQAVASVRHSARHRWYCINALPSPALPLRPATAASQISISRNSCSFGPRTSHRPT